MEVAESRIATDSSWESLHLWHQVCQAQTQIQETSNLIQLLQWAKFQASQIHELPTHWPGVIFISTLIHRQELQRFSCLALQLQGQLRYQVLQVLRPSRHHQSVQSLYLCLQNRCMYNQCHQELQQYQLHQKQQHYQILQLYQDGLPESVKLQIGLDMTDFKWIYSNLKPGPGGGWKSVARELVTYKTSLSELRFSYLLFIVLLYLFQNDHFINV